MALLNLRYLSYYGKYVSRPLSRYCASHRFGIGLYLDSSNLAGVVAKYLLTEIVDHVLAKLDMSEQYEQCKLKLYEIHTF